MALCFQFVLFRSDRLLSSATRLPGLLQCFVDPVFIPSVSAVIKPIAKFPDREELDFLLTFYRLSSGLLGAVFFFHDVASQFLHFYCSLKNKLQRERFFIRCKP